jgi:hypothetical protein
MPRAKGPVYSQNEKAVDEELLDDLQEAIRNLIENCKPKIKINRAQRHIGYGVDKAKRSIAADTVMSITRQIKARPGW